MIEYWSESREADRANFEPFRAAVQKQCPDVRFAWIGGNLLVVGTVRCLQPEGLSSTPRRRTTAW